MDPWGVVDLALVCNNNNNNENDVGRHHVDQRLLVLRPRRDQQVQQLGRGQTLEIRYAPPTTSTHVGYTILPVQIHSKSLHESLYNTIKFNAMQILRSTVFLMSLFASSLSGTRRAAAALATTAAPLVLAIAEENSNNDDNDEEENEEGENTNKKGKAKAAEKKKSTKKQDKFEFDFSAPWVSEDLFAVPAANKRGGGDVTCMTAAALEKEAAAGALGELFLPPGNYRLID